MTIVYIAGRYRSKHWLGKVRNIWRARQAGKELAMSGYVPIVPHLNTAFMDGLQSDKWWLDASLEILSRLEPGKDKIFMLKGWKKSEGSWLEWNKAKDMNLEVVYER